MMIDKLIRIALAVASTGALAACASSSDDVDAASSAQVEFRVAEASRASLTTNATIINAPFAVYGDMISSTAAAGASPIVVFNNTKVTYTDPNWTYDDTQYWFPGFTYSFVAHHPAEPNAAIVSNLNYETNSLSFTYNYPSDYKKAVDLLTATYRRRYDTGKDNKVPFTFSHLLARLNFTAKVDPTSTSPIVIESLKLSNVSTKAAYSIIPTPTQNDGNDFTAEWTDYESADQTLFDLANLNITVEPGSTYGFFLPSDALLVIPQTILQASETEKELLLEIRYHSVTGDDTGTKPASAGLSSTVLSHGGKWEGGMAYNYSFTLDDDGKIIFSAPTVTPWIETGGGNYVVTD